MKLYRINVKLYESTSYHYDIILYQTQLGIKKIRQGILTEKRHTKKQKNGRPKKGFKDAQNYIWKI